MRPLDATGTGHQSRCVLGAPGHASPPRVAVHGTLIAVQVAFASLAVAGKVVFRTLEPGALAMIRLCGGAIVLGSLALAAKERVRVPWRDVLAILGCAALGIFGNQVMFLYGLRLTTAVNAVVLVATIPVFTTLAAVLLGREPARPRALAGVAIAFAGVIWLVGGDAALGGDTVFGDLLVIANALTYSLYLVLVRDLVERHGSRVVVAIGFAGAGLASIPIGASALAAQAPAITAPIWGLIAYVVLVTTVFTYLANAWALRFAPASIVAIYIYVQPLIAAALAWIFLREIPSLRVLGTIVAVFAGIWLVTRPSPAAVPGKAGADAAV